MIDWLGVPRTFPGRAPLSFSPLLGAGRVRGPGGSRSSGGARPAGGALLPLRFSPSAVCLFSPAPPSPLAHGVCAVCPSLVCPAVRPWLLCMCSPRSQGGGITMPTTPIGPTKVTTPPRPPQPRYILQHSPLPRFLFGFSVSENFFSADRMWLQYLVPSCQKNGLFAMKPRNWECFRL